MIGNAEHAEQIARYAAEWIDNTRIVTTSNVYGPVPEGFTYLGSGASRHVFKRDGFVYKVEGSYAEGNTMEIQAISTVGESLTLGNVTFKIEPVDQYVFHGRTVNVMRYVSGEPCWAIDGEDFSDEYEWMYPELDYDLHSGNVLMVNGEMVVIDL